ncbi:MAG: hypothetical protein HN855_00585 [Anaerolineae bacterium]|jgi:hypothetical protein|nr:hypothetical protein [Anaerolineae bacterium]MBT7069697.1 hypothetical protein [Anaerolineae bacterium]MBT7323637.1 hypothetical protein [Anaerolineae bacterium]
MTTSSIEKSTVPRSPVLFGLVTTLLGLFVFTMGAKPEWFGVDRSPVVGFVQIAVFLVGLAIICIGGYVGLIALWGDDERSIAADIGLRLVSTGYVLSVFTGMADVFGMGTQPLPGIPFFGPLQAIGMEIGQGVILLGFLLTIPIKKLRQ